MIALAWFLLWRMTIPAPGGDMGAMAMTAMPPAINPGYIASAFIMWFLMMAAMMLPSASPMILLYARLAGDAPHRAGPFSPTLVFTATYLAVWAIFSLAAAALQALLIKLGLISAVALALGDHRVAGALLVAAGLYQLTPLKAACLTRCRSPLSFLMRLWRPGWRGALRLGAIHGLSCLGCCWMLMALLFIGGVMNLAWVVVLALVVLLEKIAPIGPRVARVIAAGAVLAGLVLAVT